MPSILPSTSEMNMHHESNRVTDGRIWTKTKLFGMMFLLPLALVWGGCAGDGTQTNTQENLDHSSSAQVTTASNEALSENDEEEDFLFDPFEESDDSAIEEYDPFEPVNSAIFEFNYRLDKYFVKPVAQVYNFFVPPDPQQSISNVFQNIRSFPRFFNNLLQGKFEGAGIEMSRFLINTTLGVGGLFDPAGIMFDLKTPQEDLGQTLGTYGVGPGPYIMVPFFGPFTLRDGIGFIGDIFLNPFNWFVVPITTVDDIPQLVNDGSTIRWIQAGRVSGEAVNLRALNLEKFQGVEEGTLDLYGAVRNGYLQQRLKAIKE